MELVVKWDVIGNVIQQVQDPLNNCPAIFFTAENASNGLLNESQSRPLGDVVGKERLQNATAGTVILPEKIGEEFNAKRHNLLAVQILRWIQGIFYVWHID